MIAIISVDDWFGYCFATVFGLAAAFLLALWIAVDVFGMGTKD